MLHLFLERTVRYTYAFSRPTDIGYMSVETSGRKWTNQTGPKRHHYAPGGKLANWTQRGENRRDIDLVRKLTKYISTD